MSFEESLIRVVEETVRRVVREELQAKGPEWISIEEAMERTGLSESTVRRMVKDREVTATKIRGRVRIDAASLAPTEAEVVDLAARVRGR